MARIAWISLGFDDEWRLQSVMILELDDDDESVPVVNGRVRAGRQVTATVVVYGGQNPILSAGVRAADELAGNSEAPVFFSQPLPRRDGRHVGTATWADASSDPTAAEGVVFAVRAPRPADEPGA